MNEELMASFERKMRGYIEAAKQLGVPCETCGQWLSPKDTGVDPLNGVRYWITDCCGNFNQYEEKVDGFTVVMPDV